MIDRLALLLLVGGCLLFGTILFIELAPANQKGSVVNQTAARSDAPNPAIRPQSGRPEELVSATLARPLFASTRRPPQDASNAAVGDDLSDSRLTGIVTMRNHRVAIFAVSGDKPLKVAEGDTVSGWRIESITPREVSLTGPSGTKTLQPKLDPTLAAPPVQPPNAQVAGRPPIPPAAARPRAPVPGAPGAVQPSPGVPVNTPGAPRPARPRQ